jgi:hypothetical protein
MRQFMAASFFKGEILQFQLGDVGGIRGLQAPGKWAKYLGL